MYLRLSIRKLGKAKWQHPLLPITTFQIRCFATLGVISDGISTRFKFLHIKLCCCWCSILENPNDRLHQWIFQYVTVMLLWAYVISSCTNQYGYSTTSNRWVFQRNTSATTNCGLTRLFGNYLFILHIANLYCSLLTEDHSRFHQITGQFTIYIFIFNLLQRFILGLYSNKPPTNGVRVPAD